MKIKTIRQATNKEKSTPIETIRYALIESYERRIEKANLKKDGKSICAGSMYLPYGLITCMEHGGKMVDIHANWRDILNKEYLK